MLHAYVQRFDVTENFEKFCKILETKQAPSHRAQKKTLLSQPQKRDALHVTTNYNFGGAAFPRRGDDWTAIVFPGGPNATTGAGPVQSAIGI